MYGTKHYYCPLILGSTYRLATLFIIWLYKNKLLCFVMDVCGE